MTFWEKIYENTIILWEDKIKNFAKIVTLTKYKIFDIILDKFNYNKNYIELDLTFLEEILKNSVDALNLKGFFANLKVKKVEIKIYKKNNELIFIIRDNWKCNKILKTINEDNNEKLWWEWLWEKFIKSISRNIKYKRISKKSGSIILLKIDTLKILEQDKIDKLKNILLKK